MDLIRESTPHDYDVVITGNGDGEALAFIEELYSTLAETGLCVSKITQRVSRTRQKSRISIIVFSKEFASAVWLLRLLVAVLESSSDCLVVPLFYGVDPSEIRDQTGSSAAVFARYEKQYMLEQVETWRIALRKASDLAGFLYLTQSDRQDSTRIQKIVDFIAEGLKKDNISLWCDKECRLMNSGLSMLPENMTFPALTKLFLQDNYDLSEIPLSFFEFMPTLMVLDMSRTCINDLPASISHLVQLKTLLLRDCKLLMELPPEIQALKNLKVFDLEGTELINIPKEIGMLTRLERLIVSLCDCADEYVSEVIPRDTLSKLSNLKELSIFVDPACKWWREEVQFTIWDLHSLVNLEIVKLYFPTVQALEVFLHIPRVIYQSIKKFRLIVGHHDQDIISRVPRDLQDSFEALDKCLKFVNGEGNMEIVGEVLNESSAFILDRHWTIDQLSRFKLNQIENLKFCMLVECNEMINVIGGYNGRTPVLQMLEYLCIYYMKNLESILAGPVAEGSFYNLQVLDIHTCPQLTTIVNAELLINLVRLEELIVEDCPKVESIVSIQSSQLKSSEEFLPNLKKISVLHLPGLVSIFSGLHTAPRLESMVIFNCPKLHSNSLVEISTANIKEIKGESVWWETLEWKSNQPPDNLGRVFVPFSVDGLIIQLAEARNSRNSLNMINNQKNRRYIKDKHLIMERKEFDLKIPEDQLNTLKIQTRNLVRSDVEVKTLNKDKSDSNSSPNLLKLIFDLSESIFSRDHREKLKEQFAISRFSSGPETSKGPNKLKSDYEKLPHPPDKRFNPNAMSWQKGKFLGSGSLGTVYEGITDDGFVFAVKEVLHDWEKQTISQLEWDISVLSRLKHENIVQYLGTKTDDNKLYIFLELAPKSSLVSLYQKFNLQDSQVSAFTRQILSGLSYLHSQNVAHMDIKCANILADLNGSVKLVDFGVKQLILQNGYKKKADKHFLWMPPEAVKYTSLDLKLPGDIWSLGCTVLEMLTRQVPYFSFEGKQVPALFKICNGQLPDIPDSLSEDARDFILKCLQVNPDDRPSAVQLLNHAFVNNSDNRGRPAAVQLLNYPSGKTPEIRIPGAGTPPLYTKTIKYVVAGRRDTSNKNIERLFPPVRNIFGSGEEDMLEDENI